MTTFGILSTYPPTQCGLATFSAALRGALRGPSDLVDIVAVVDAAEVPRHHVADGPVHHWVRGTSGGATHAADCLNDYDIAIIQHEYGIFGGADGSDVLDVLRQLTVPSIVVLHTVLTTPTLRQRAILDELVLHASAVVTMTHTARERVIEHYVAGPDDVHVVPHGAPEHRPVVVPTLTEPHRDRSDGSDQRPTILTWGLLGSGKGIEWAIEAMAGLGDLDPAPRYLIVGETHPKVVEYEGERYREGLEQRVLDLGLGDVVEFDERYLTTSDLHDLVRRADVVLLPYDSQEQVTSGVLVEAVTACRPIVATGFPHARELLSSGAGLLVDRQSPAAIAAAVRRVLTEPGLAARMTAEATRIAPDLLWPAVADQYRHLAARALAVDADDDRLSA
ncbi:MAG: glycosyltransferase [Lapillicoccus sp.]